MLGGVIRATADASSFAENAIDDVIVGCGNQAGEDSRCVVRHALLRAGFGCKSADVFPDRCLAISLLREPL